MISPAFSTTTEEKIKSFRDGFFALLGTGLIAVLSAYATGTKLDAYAASQIFMTGVATALIAYLNRYVRAVPNPTMPTSTDVASDTQAPTGLAQ